MTIAACAAIFATTLCSGKKNVAEQAAETPAEVLLGRLTALSDSGLTAFGHHDDTAYGRYWEYQPDSSDVKNVCGDYPAIINWDLGWIETGAEKQLDGVPFDFMRDEIVRTMLAAASTRCHGICSILSPAVTRGTQAVTPP